MQDLLPEDFCYSVLSFKEIDNPFLKNGKSFILETKIKGIFTENDAMNWLQLFELKIWDAVESAEYGQNCIIKQACFQEGL